jgi:hypothetical protein
MSAKYSYWWSATAPATGMATFAEFWARVPYSKYASGRAIYILMCDGSYGMKVLVNQAQWGSAGKEWVNLGTQWVKDGGYCGLEVRKYDLAGASERIAADGVAIWFHTKSAGP